MLWADIVRVRRSEARERKAKSEGGQLRLLQLISTDTHMNKVRIRALQRELAGVLRVNGRA